MSKPINDLELERTRLLTEIGALHDLRPGCVTGIVRRCGKPSCHCTRSGDPSHGPTLRLTYKAKGKTIDEALPPPAAIRKAEREIHEFRKYQQLSRAFVAVNEGVCRLRKPPMVACTDADTSGNGCAKGTASPHGAIPFGRAIALEYGPRLLAYRTRFRSRGYLARPRRRRRNADFGDDLLRRIDPEARPLREAEDDRLLAGLQRRADMLHAQHFSHNLSSPALRNQRLRSDGRSSAANTVKQFRHAS